MVTSVVSVAYEGALYRVQTTAASLDELKAKLSASIGLGPIAELRCARTGARLSRIEEVSAEDSFIASRTATKGAADAEGAFVPLSVYADAVGVQWNVDHVAVLAPCPSTLFPSSSAFFVALAAGRSRGGAGRRYVLHVRHGEGESEGGPLAAEFVASLDRLGAHPHILLPLWHRVCPPPPECAPSLPPSLPPDAPLPCLLTEAYLPLDTSRRASLGELLSYALDLLQALVHARRCGVVHRAVSPASLCVSTSLPSRLLLGGWGHALTTPIEARSAGEGPAPLAWAWEGSGSVTLAALGPRPEWAAPELHAAVGTRPPFLSYEKADVWSAGATLGALLMGAHPWPGAGARAGGGLASVLAAYAPPALAIALDGMTVADPTRRLTARAALVRLQAAAAGRPCVPLPAYPTGGPALAAHPRFASPGLVLPSSSPSPQSREEEGGGVFRGRRERGSGGKEEEADEGMGEGGEGKEGEGGAHGGPPLPLLLRLAPPGGAPLRGPSPFAAVPYTAVDSDTVAVLIARACELLEGGEGGGLSLLWAGGRVDPAAPVHLLPPALLASPLAGRVLCLVPGLGGLDPAVSALGYGVTQLPGPPPLPHGALQLLPPPFAMLPPPAVGGAARPPAAAPHVQPTTLPFAPAIAVPASEGTGTSPARAPVVSRGAEAAVAAPGGAAEGVAQPSLAQFSPSSKAGTIGVEEGGTTASTRGVWGTVALADVIVSVGGGQAGGPALLPGGRCSRYIFSVAVTAMDSGAGCAIGFYAPGYGRFDPTANCFGNVPFGWAYSRSGKISSGSAASWVEYGAPFGAGDVITADLDLPEAPVGGGPAPAPTLTFYKNGVPQGVAFSGADLMPALTSPGPPLAYIPAITMGSGVGGKLVRAELQPPEPREFDRGRAHHRVQVSPDGTRVTNTGKWATLLLAHPGMRTGRMTWHLRLDDTKHGAGVAMGVVDASSFAWGGQNLGASPGSWCYSKTGKKGDGSGFHLYGKPYTSGDTVTIALDMDANTLSFAINGDTQGVAYTAEHGIGSCPLVPALCIGSTEGDKMAQVSLVQPLPPVLRFLPWAANPKLTLVDGGRAVETRDKWGTIFADAPIIRGRGKFSFAMAVTSAGTGCGAGIGFAVLSSEAKEFDPLSRNLGAHPGSWCFSKTGKFAGHLSRGATSIFGEYGTPFKTGDIITAEVDLDKEVMHFYINGRDQGARETPGISRSPLRPALVLGSSEGGHYTKLTLAPPAVVRFDPYRLNKFITISDDDKRVATDLRWSSALAAHPGVMAGSVLRFAVRLEGDGGAAIGFADASSFKVFSQNLGASPGTWAISKTGKVSCGDAEGFRSFSEKFGASDVIGAEADMVDGTIRFWKNGVLLGTAFQGLLSGGEAEWMPKPLRPLALVPSVCLGTNKGGKHSSAHLVEFNLDWCQQS